MSQPASKKRKLNNEQSLDQDYDEFPPALISNSHSTPPTVRIKSRKRGFFQKKRTYKPSPQLNDVIPIPTNNNSLIQSNYSMPIPIPPPTYYDNNYTHNSYDNNPINNNYNYDYEQTEEEEDEEYNVNNNGLSDEDKMRNICDELNIRKGIHIGVNLYGFINHLTVYEEIYRLAQIENDNQRNDIIKSYNSNKLRDIKSKIQSSGKTGKKNEMIHGICKKLLEFKKNYQQNNNYNTNEIEHKTQSDINALPPAMDVITAPPPAIEIVNDTNEQPIEQPMEQTMEQPMEQVMEEPIDMNLINLVRRFTGSQGSKCDGCGMTMENYKQYENLEDIEDSDLLDGFIKQICGNCKYGVCEYCEVHNSRGTCYCTNSNFGQAYDTDVNKREWYQGGKVTMSQRIKANKMMEQMEEEQQTK